MVYADLPLRPILTVKMVILLHVLEVIAELCPSVSASSGLAQGIVVPISPSDAFRTDHRELPFSDSSSTTRNAGNKSRKLDPMLWNLRTLRSSSREIIRGDIECFRRIDLPQVSQASETPKRPSYMIRRSGFDAFMWFKTSSSL